MFIYYMDYREYIHSTHIVEQHETSGNQTNE